MTTDVVISGLVVTLSGEPESCARALAHIHSDPRVTCGERLHNLFPVVVELPTLEASEAFVRSLEDTDGVVHVHVVSIDFPDDEPDDEPGDHEVCRRLNDGSP